MKNKFWMIAALICLLGYGAVFFLQYQSACAQAVVDVQQRQLWLARQSARLLGAELAGGALLGEALRHLEVDGADGRIGASRLALYDRQAGQLVSEASRLSGLGAEIDARAELQKRLQRGGHGHLELDLAGVPWLATYLPLRAGDQFLTLIVLMPADSVVQPVTTMAAAGWALPLLLCAGMAALRGGWGRGTRAPSQEDAESANSDRNQEQLREMQAQCQALIQENALLGVARREYQLLVEGAGHGLARLNSSGLILFCSKPMLQILGCERKEIVGRNLLDLDLILPETRKQLQRTVGQLREGQLPPPLTGRLRRADGSLAEVELRLSPLGVAGENTGFLLQLHFVELAATYLKASVP